MKVSDELFKLVKQDNQLFPGYFQQMKQIVENKLEQKMTFDIQFKVFLKKVFKIGKDFTTTINNLILDFTPEVSKNVFHQEIKHQYTSLLISLNLFKSDIENKIDKMMKASEDFDRIQAESQRASSSILSVFKEEISLFHKKTSIFLNNYSNFQEVFEALQKSNSQGDQSSERFFDKCDFLEEQSKQEYVQLL